MHCRFLWKILVASACVVGCNEARPQLPAPADDPTADLGSQFDPATTGTIRGQIRWSGELPLVPLLKVPPTLDAEGQPRPREWPNPHVPLIDSASAGVGNAVVFLRALNLKKSRPWNHEVVTAQQTDYQFSILQGKKPQRVGFVRRGASVEMVSCQRAFHALHADGASFFTVAFPDADRPSTRKLTEKGIVELSSAAGYFWMRAHLFVDDHPYYACPDADGRYILPQVPAGRYEVVCWLPNWREDRRTLDPASGVCTRLFFRPAVELVIPLEVRPGETTQADFAPSLKAFRP